LQQILINGGQTDEWLVNARGRGKSVFFTDEGEVKAAVLNLNLRCYVMIELKTGDFKPAYAGQLNFYLSAVDGILKKEQDNPSIGLLLCKSKNDLVAEYSLKDMSKPIGVSEYQITCNLPTELEKQLPTVEDIQKHIQRQLLKIPCRMERLERRIAKIAFNRLLQNLLESSGFRGFFFIFYHF